MKQVNVLNTTSNVRLVLYSLQLLLLVVLGLRTVLTAVLEAFLQSAKESRMTMKTPALVLRVERRCKMIRKGAGCNYALNSQFMPRS